MHPYCLACGNYLMPCTATATGVHPEVVIRGDRPDLTEIGEDPEP